MRDLVSVCVTAGSVTRMRTDDVSLTLCSLAGNYIGWGRQEGVKALAAVLKHTQISNLK